jgi:ribosomal protein S12 methylthiotransferase
MARENEPHARVFFHTLGCPKNDADSRTLMRRMAAAGAQVVQDPADCTHIVVNTCGFIKDAKEESIGAILDVCASYPGKQVLVMGCLVERYREELTRGIPEVSGWFGVAGDDASGDLVQAVLGGESGASPAEGILEPENKAYAYIKISDGCDEGCTFCAIPGFKGPYRSVPTAEILREANACLAEGARELVLVGQDTTLWRSGGRDLCGLIDLLAADARVKWDTSHVSTACSTGNAFPGVHGGPRQAVPLFGRAVSALAPRDTGQHGPGWRRSLVSRYSAEGA